MKKSVLSIAMLIVVVGIVLFVSCDKSESQNNQTTPREQMTKEKNNFTLFFETGTMQCHVTGNIGSDLYGWNVVDGNNAYSFNRVFIDETPIRCIPVNDNTVTVLYGVEDGTEMNFSMTNISQHGDTLSYRLSLGNFGTQSFEFVASNSLISSVLDELFDYNTPNTKALPTQTHIYQLIYLSTRETAYILQVEGNPYFPNSWESTYLCYFNNPSFLTPCKLGQTRIEHHYPGHHNCWFECVDKIKN